MAKKKAKIPDHDYAAILTKYTTMAQIEIAALVGQEIPISVVAVLTVHTTREQAAQSFGMSAKIDLSEDEGNGYLDQVLKMAIRILAKNPAVERHEFSKH